MKVALGIALWAGLFVVAIVGGDEAIDRIERWARE